MAKSLKERNAMECSKAARKRYAETHKDKFKYQSVCFLTEEIEEINRYCDKHGIAKNRFFREACMDFMGKGIY